MMLFPVGFCRTQQGGFGGLKETAKACTSQSEALPLLVGGEAPDACFPRQGCGSRVSPGRGSVERGNTTGSFDFPFWEQSNRPPSCILDFYVHFNIVLRRKNPAIPKIPIRPSICPFFFGLYFLLRRNNYFFFPVAITSGITGGAAILLCERTISQQNAL